MRAGLARGALAAALLAAAWPRGVAHAQVPGADSARSVVPLPPRVLFDSSAAARPRPLSRPLRVCAGGDVTLGTNLDPRWPAMARRRLRDEWKRSDDPDSLLAPLRPALAGADLVLLNVEGAIGDGAASRKCGPHSANCFAFRMPLTAAAALRRVADSAVVVGNVANNHARDAGPDGFLATQARLREAGVLVTGADTMPTLVPLPSGDTIAVLGFYTSTETPDARDLAAVRRHVARAAANYSIVIVSGHIGAEGVGAQRTFATNEQFLGTIDRGNPVGFADSAFAGGATLVIAHGPHVLRAAEWNANRLAFYSLGNLLTYGPFGMREPTNRGAVACATIDSAGSVRDGRIISTVQLAPGVLQLDSTGRAARLVDSLSVLDFPATGARLDSSGAIAPPAPSTDTVAARRGAPLALIARPSSSAPPRANRARVRRVAPRPRAGSRVPGGG